MSDEIIGSAVIEIRADTSDLERALEGVRLEAMSTTDRLEKLNRAWKEGSIPADVYYGELAKIDGKLNELGAKEQGINDLLRSQAQAAADAARSLDQVATAASHVTAGAGAHVSAATAAGNATAAMGDKAKGQGAFGMIVFAQAIDDAQYGMRGLGNNLVQMAAMFGGPYAGAIAIATAAGTVLFNQWDNIKELLDLGSTLDEAARMEQLGNKTQRTADEQREYNRLKREQADIERLSQMRTREQEDTKAAVEEVVRESGGNGVTGFNRIVKGLVEQRKTEGTFERMGPDDREQLTRLDKQIADYEAANPGRVAKKFRDDRQAIKDRIEKEGVHRAEKDVMAATGGGNALTSLIHQVEKTPGAFPEGLSDRLREATPEARQEAAEVDAQFEASGREATESGKRTSRTLGRARKGHEQETAETARTFKPGLADDIATIYAQGMIDRLDPAATLAKARAEVAKRLAAAGIQGPGLDKAIDQLVGEFQKDFTGRMAGAGLGRDGVTKTMAAQTVIDRTKRAREAAAAAEKAEKEADRGDKADVAKHAKDVAASVKTFGPVFDNQLAVAMFNHGLRDATAEQSDAKLRPQLLDRLKRQTTIPEDQREAVADAMLKAARARADQQKAQFMQTPQGMFNYGRLKRDARARARARSQAKGKPGKPPGGTPKAPPKAPPQGKGKPGATAMNGMPSPNAMPSPAAMPPISAVAGMQQLQGMTAAVLSTVLKPMEAKLDMSKTEAQQDKLVQIGERTNTLLGKIANNPGYARLAPGEAVFG